MMYTPHTIRQPPHLSDSPQICSGVDELQSIKAAPSARIHAAKIPSNHPVHYQPFAEQELLQPNTAMSSAAPHSTPLWLRGVCVSACVGVRMRALKMQARRLPSPHTTEQSPCCSTREEENAFFFLQEPPLF